MKSTCPLTDAVVELTLEAPASSEVATHHKARCATCRHAADLARASLEVWRADAPTAAEISRARARIGARARPTVPTHRPVWLIAVAVLVAGGAATAALAPPWSPLASLRSEPSPVVAPTAAATSSHVVRARAPSSAIDEPVAAAVDSSPERSEPSIGTRGSSGHRPAPSDPSAAAVARAEVPPTTRPDPPAASAPIDVAREETVVNPPAANTSDAWPRVAEAMRRGDTKAAESALGELEGANDAATRDAARLARAELQIAAGHGDAARPTLTDLAAHGATPLVRRRAAELLGAAR